MNDALPLLVPIIGAPIVLLIIASPLVMLWYQNKRNFFFKEIADRYQLKYTQNYPYKTNLFNTLLSNPPKTSRLIEGQINGRVVSVGDYIDSIYWQPNRGKNPPSFWQSETTAGKTRFSVDSKEKTIRLPFYWGLATRKQILSFLGSVK